MKNVAIIIGMVILLTGCGGGGGGGSNSPSDQTPTTPTTPIVDHPIFNMVGAERLVIAPISSTAVVNSIVGEEKKNTLMKVNENGVATPVITSSGGYQYPMSKVVNGQDGYVYAQADSTAIKLEDGFSYFILKIDPQTGDYTGFSTDRLYNSGFNSDNPSMQWDSDGNLYYHTIHSEDNTHPIYKIDQDGTKTAIAVNAQNFLVVGNSKVLYVLNGNQLVYVNNNQVSTVVVANINWIHVFPDESVYVCTYTSSEGFKIIKLDPNYLTYTNYVQQNQTPDTMTDDEFFMFMSCVSNNTQVFVEGDSKVYMYGSESGQSYMYSLYPSVTKITISLTSIYKACSYNNHILIAGCSTENKVISYDPLQDTEEGDVFGNSYNVAIDHLSHRSTKIMFDGLDFNTNKVVIGKHENGETTITPITGSDRLVESIDLN